VLGFQELYRVSERSQGVKELGAPRELLVKNSVIHGLQTNETSLRINIGPGSIPGTTRFSEKKKERQKKVVCLERGALSLVSTTEELLDRKVAAPV
jgi:hypothetical protein